MAGIGRQTSGDVGRLDRNLLSHRVPRDCLAMSQERGCIQEGRAMFKERSQGVATAPQLSEIESMGRWTDRHASDQARRASAARQTSGRRRKIDPTTSERDYSPEELEFMTAMQEYKRRSGRMFPTWSEVLEVLHELGYEKHAASDDGRLLSQAAGPVARP